MAAPTDYIAFCTLSEDVSDVTNTYNGTNNGGITFDGEISTFDGVNDYVSTPTISLGITYTCSVFASWSGSNTEVLVGNNSTSDLSYIIAVTDTYLYIARKGSGAYGQVTHGLGSSWDMTHFVVIQDATGNNIRCYINDVAQTVSYTNTIIDTGYIDRIGQWYGSDNSVYFYQGDVANVKIYDYALTETEVGDLYSEGYLLAPESIANISVTATAEATRQPQSTANIEVTATAEVTQYVTDPQSTANIEVTATAEVSQYYPESTAYISVTATAEVQAGWAETNTFSFVYSLQRSQIETSFKFIYSLEQPEVETKIIVRTNT